jgi:hypothetical protein
MHTKTEGQEAMRRRRHTCEENVKMDLKELRWEEDVDWVHLTQIGSSGGLWCAW